jgi:hypothetical protein
MPRVGQLLQVTSYGHRADAKTKRQIIDRTAPLAVDHLKDLAVPGGLAQAEGLFIYGHSCLL